MRTTPQEIGRSFARLHKRIPTVGEMLHATGRSDDAWRAVNAATDYCIRHGLDGYTPPAAIPTIGGK